MGMIGVVCFRALGVQVVPIRVPARASMRVLYV